MFFLSAICWYHFFFTSFPNYLHSLQFIYQIHPIITSSYTVSMSTSYNQTLWVPVVSLLTFYIFYQSYLYQSYFLFFSSNHFASVISRTSFPRPLTSLVVTKYLPWSALSAVFLISSWISFFYLWLLFPLSSSDSPHPPH